MSYNCRIVDKWAVQWQPRINAGINQRRDCTARGVSRNTIGLVPWPYAVFCARAAAHAGLQTTPAHACNIGRMGPQPCLAAPAACLGDHSALRKLFEIEVFRFLRKRELLSRQRMELILSWPHSGFNVHIGETIEMDDTPGLTRVARYMLRAPLMLSRITYDREHAAVRIEPHSARGRESLELDVLDFIARLTAQIPEPHERLVLYYGLYANASRQRRVTGGGHEPAACPADHADGDESAWLRSRRIRWARLIRMVWQQDPLLCPRCGGAMRIISFITDRTVIDTILRHIGFTHPATPPPRYHPPPQPCGAPLG